MQALLIGCPSKNNEVTGQSLNFDLLISHLIKNQHQFKVLDINVYNYPTVVKGIFYLFFALKLFVILLMNRRIKVVYLTIAQSTSGFFRDFFFIWVARIFNKKIVLHLHGGNYKNFYHSQPPFFQKIIKKTLEQSNILIVLSSVFNEMFDFINNYKDKTRVVKNGIIDKNFKAIEKLYDPKQPKLIYLSNLIESKGYLDVLHSIKILRDKFNINATIDFCGNFMESADDLLYKGNLDGAKSHFFNFIKENNLENNVFFKGLVVGENKDELLRNAQIMLLPTEYIAEGQPMSLIEGLCNSCVLITTPYRDVVSLNIDKETGYMVEYNNPEAIAKAIASLDSVTTYNELSKNAYWHYKQNFSFENRVNDLKNIIYESA